MKNYLLELVQNIMKTMLIDTKIELQTEIDDVSMNINQAIPTALIINEAVSNSIEHAFTGRDKGIISIIFKLENGSYYLCICDDGVGIDKNVKLSTIKSLGLKLIETLSKQLHADFSIDKKLGTKISIQYKAENKKGIVYDMVNENLFFLIFIFYFKTKCVSKIPAAVPIQNQGKCRFGFKAVREE